MGMFFALAIALSFLESLLVGFFALPPGVKIGLANIVVMYAFLCLGKTKALLLIVLKAIFALLTRGLIAGMLSLCGGLLSFAILLLLYKQVIKKQYYIISVCSAIAHNIGQLLFLNIILDANYSLYYAPVLIISGLIMGAVTSISLKILLPHLNRMKTNY